MEVPELPLDPELCRIVETAYYKEYSEWRWYLVPFFPLSYNNALISTRGGGRFMRTEYCEYKTGIKDFLRNTDIEACRFKLFGDAYEVRIFGLLDRERFFYKNGNFRRMDADGFIKLIQDVLFEYLEVDDCHVLSIHAEKILADPLPTPTLRYSENPTWEFPGGNILLGMRCVPIAFGEDGERIAEYLEQAETFHGYISPKVNFNKAKKQQKKIAEKKAAKAAAPARNIKKRVHKPRTTKKKKTYDEVVWEWTEATKESK